MCIPGLHISLGIFDRLWELLENACNELDLAIIKDQHQAMDGFGQYVKALDDVQQLRGKLNTLYQHAALLGELITYLMLHLPNPASDPILKQVQVEASNHDRTITITV